MQSKSKRPIGGAGDDFDGKTVESSESKTVESTAGKTAESSEGTIGGASGDSSDGVSGHITDRETEKETGGRSALRGLWLYPSALIAAALAFLLARSGYGKIPLAYAADVTAVWLFLRSLRSAAGSVRRFGKRKLDEHPRAGQLVGDYGFRTVLSAYAAFCINLLFAGFKFMVCAETGSLWFGILGGYYAMLGISRYLAVDSRRRALTEPTETVRRIALFRTLRQSGFLMMGMTLFLIAAVWELTVHDYGFSDVPGFLYAICGVAVYTVFKVVSAVVNVSLTHRLSDPALSAVREIGYADALVSLYALQTSCLLFFGGDGETRRFFNLLTGTFVCIPVFLLGLYMVLRAALGIRRVKRSAEGAVPVGGHPHGGDPTAPQ